MTQVTDLPAPQGTTRQAGKEEERRESGVEQKERGSSTNDDGAVERKLLHEVMRKKQQIREMESALESLKNSLSAQHEAMTEKEEKMNELYMEEKLLREKAQSELSKLERRSDLQRLAKRFGVVEKVVDFYQGEATEDAFKNFLSENPFFKEASGGLPSLLPSNPRLPMGDKSALTAEELRIAVKLGISPDAYAKAKKSR